MTTDQRFVSARFPRSARYHPDWILSCVSGGANSLWMTEWLAEALRLIPESATKAEFRTGVMQV